MKKGDRAAEPPKANLNIVFLGQGSRGEICKKALEDAGYNLLLPHPELEDVDLDLIVMAGHTKILPKRLIETARYGAINCHAGKLPEYRGASVLNWQIINGETKGYVSIVQVDEGIDTGDILAEAEFKIKPDDTIVEVRYKAHLLFAKLLPKVVKQIETGIAKPIKQKTTGCAYWHHRKPNDSKVNFDKMTIRQIYNLVRACEYPYTAFVGNYNITSAKLRDDNILLNMKPKC